MPSGSNNPNTRPKSSHDFWSKAHADMGAKHALISLVYLVGAALLFSLARMEFWQEKTPQTERLEHSAPVLDSSLI